jgi:hypothetical protein
MVSEPKSCAQSPSVTHFSLRVIPPSLARSPYGGALLSTHMARARGCGSHTVGGDVALRIKGFLAPSISPGFYSWIGRGGASNSYKLQKM